jgi:hypothetical protein
MSQITGNVVITATLTNANGQSVYNRQNQTFPVFGNELKTATYDYIPPGGITITLPANGSGNTVQIVDTFLADGIATYTFVPPISGTPLSAGQNVSVINCVNGSAFNITNQVILNVTSNQFTVAVTHADISQAQEYVATATTSGVSFIYMRNSGAAVINVIWTPIGGMSETVLPLPPGAEVTMTFPNGNAGINALSFSSDITIQSDIVTQVSLLYDVATLTTQNYHGFSVGQLVTTTGITNNAGLFNVTTQLITAVTNTTFSFVLVNANIPQAAATGTTPEALVSYAVPGATMEWAILA